MTCPFLKEAQVKYCRTANVRKLIPLAQAGRTEEKCTSEEYRTCKVFQAQAPVEEEEAGGRCPYLRESLMQYCSAAPVTKLVPYSETLLSRCGNDGFRYCELYLTMARPGAPSEAVAGVAMPAHLRYCSNHMWLDVGEDGTCHAGIDAFLSRVLGPIERIAYMQAGGRRRPSAVLTANGVDFEVTFPNPFLVTGCNLYLRADAARIAKAPYTAGWLFQGQPSEETLENLREGDEARQWMEQEQRRMTDFLQQEGTMADGGTFSANLAYHLDREQMLILFQEFFSPYASGKRN